MTDENATPSASETATQKPAKKKGENIKIMFLDEAGKPSQDGMIMRCLIVQTGHIEDVNLSEILEAHPQVALAILRMGAKTIAANSVNTAPTAKEGQDILLGRLDGWRNGSYTSTSRVLGVPLFIRAIPLALEKMGLGTPESRQTVMDNWLAKYRAEGKFDHLEGEEQTKAIRKHQAAVRKEVIAKEGIEEAMAEISAQSDKPKAKGDISDLL